MKRVVLYAVALIVAAAMCLQGTVMFPDHPASVGISSALVAIAIIEFVEHYVLRRLR